MQWGGPGFRAALSSFIRPHRGDLHTSAGRLRRLYRTGNLAGAVLNRYQCQNWPVAIIAKPEPQKRQCTRQDQTPTKRPTGAGTRPKGFWVQGTCRTGTRRRTLSACHRPGIRNAWNDSSVEVTTLRRDRQEVVKASGGATRMIDVTGSLRPVEPRPCRKTTFTEAVIGTLRSIPRGRAAALRTRTK